jgi:hypothetical protein
VIGEGFLGTPENCGATCVNQHGDDCQSISFVPSLMYCYMFSASVDVAQFPAIGGNGTAYDRVCFPP